MLEKGKQTITLWGLYNNSNTQEIYCKDIVEQIMDQTWLFSNYVFEDSGLHQEVNETWGKHAALRRCIFMSVSPESMANGPDTVRGDHLQGKSDRSPLVY